MAKLASISDIQDEAVRAILRPGDTRGGSAPVTPQHKRAAYREAAERSGPPEPVSSVENQSVGGPAGDIPIRIYRPDARAPLPLVIYLHGGAFISGDLDSHDPVCRSIANRTPAIVLGVHYRLAPEYRHPAPLEDCLAVLTWACSEASRLGSDRSRIAVAGDSAGGNLAAVIAALGRDDRAPRVAAQALIYPVLDATLRSESLVVNGLIPPFTLLDCVYMWQQYLPVGADRRDPTISPLHLPNFSRLPPTLVITAQFDILCGECLEYVSRLSEAHVPVEHAHYSGMTHGFVQWGGTVDAARSAIARLAAYLRNI